MILIYCQVVSAGSLREMVFCSFTWSDVSYAMATAYIFLISDELPWWPPELLHSGLGCSCLGSDFLPPLCSFSLTSVGSPNNHCSHNLRQQYYNTILIISELVIYSASLLLTNSNRIMWYLTMPNQSTWAHSSGTLHNKSHRYRANPASNTLHSKSYRYRANYLASNTLHSKSYRYRAII